MRYLNIFIEMVVTDIVFLLKLEKRDCFKIRLPVTIVVFGVLSYFAKYIGLPEGWEWTHSLIPLSLGMIFTVICYKLNLLKGICFGIVAYSIQHTAFILHYIIMSYVTLSMSLASLIDYCLFFGVLCVYWLLFGRNLHIEQVLNIKNAKAVLICVLMLIITYTFSMSEYNFNISTDLTACVSNVIIIYLSLTVLFGISREDVLEREKMTIGQMLEREQQYHRLSKENIEMINIKCHDLKHLIEVTRAGGGVAESDIRELEQAIAVYDGSVRTGNDDLDLVIAEKNLRCMKQGITLACMIDGKLMDFMSSGDLYSLFGNAIDNAIEYLGKVEDENKRLINVFVRQNGAFIGIRVENFCAERLKFENGLPETTKSDKNFHGFGTKSMRYIVEKYGGSISFDLKNEMFSVNIIFPAINHEQRKDAEPSADQRG